MIDPKKVIIGLIESIEGESSDGATKYHQQAQARAQKRTVYRAELKQDKKGMYTLTPEKVKAKEPKA